MSDKLKRIAAERDKARKKRDEWDERMKEWDRKYREQENTEIHDLVHKAELTPEQLAEIIRQAMSTVPNPDKLKEMMEETEDYSE